MGVDFGRNVTFGWSMGFFYSLENPAYKLSDPLCYYLMGWEGVQLWLLKKNVWVGVCARVFVHMRMHL